SNTFAIYKKLGISLNIINKAKTMIGTDEKEINEMIESLERNYKRVETQRLELDRLVKEAEQVHDDLSKQYQQFQNYEKSLIEEAKEKANQKIKAATKEADDIIKDLRQLREQKGADVKEHELIDKKKRLD
ncbi:endonuclease MutS2, partial [Escherichia coli]|nr:endonuclease MutS2 [Escherichia coli]